MAVRLKASTNKLSIHPFAFATRDASRPWKGLLRMGEGGGVTVSYSNLNEVVAQSPW